MANMPKVLFLALIIQCFAFGEVSTKVYLRDSNEFFVPIDVNSALQYIDYGQIMAGTQLSIIVDSNVAEHWSGRLLLEDDNMNQGQLYGRGPYDEYGIGYSGSILEAAGFLAAVFSADSYWEDEDKYVQGLDFYNSPTQYVSVGEWFIADYNAIEIGDVNLAFYWQQDYPPFDYGLIYQIKFEHVPTRDFDSNYRVDFADFSILAGYWEQGGCAEPNWCEGADLDKSGEVYIDDLALFAEFWLEKTR
ncbi:MAG: hypothetical protein WCZ89_02150 [Phycisphaerae bacterium]